MTDAELIRLIDGESLGLTPRESQVLRMLNGLGEPFHSLESSGIRFAVTKERMRVVYGKAVAKLPAAIVDALDARLDEDVGQARLRRLMMALAQYDCHRHDPLAKSVRECRAELMKEWEARRKGER